MSEQGDRSFPPGAFCWIELGTTDAAAAGRFYARVFDYGTETVDMGDMGSYTLLRLDGNDLAGAFDLSEEQRQDGARPNWLSFVRVTDVRDTVRRAGELGASVLTDASEVPDVGHIAILKDPTGAALGLFEAGAHSGATPSDNRPGSFCWNELATRDPESARRFYGELFGWSADTSDPVYTMFLNDGRLAGGMLEISEQMGDMAPSWMVYFATADCDETVAAAQREGATVLVPPAEISDAGRFSVLLDPQGARFAVIKLHNPEPN